MPAALLCAVLLCGAAQDPVRVTASLSAQRINVGETTTLQITVETRGDAPEEIRVPALSRDLEILGTSDYTQTQISVPGGRTRATRREIVIIARSPGVYRIPPVVTRVSGMIYRTSPLDLIVTSGGVATRVDPSISVSTLHVALNPDTVYVGEQVILRAEATFTEEMRSRQSRPATFDPPAPTGFWIQDLPDPISVTLRVREGRTVETQTYRRAYFPLSAGTYHFPPARLHYEVRRGFLYAAETRELVSDSVPLVVLPVPAVGRPATYGGAVGRLTLRASVAPAAIRAGEATVLTVEVDGTGNVKALPQPRLPRIRGAEVFPPSQESRVDVNDDRVGGMKRFRWMLVPELPGTLVIPPVEYAVFDPELRTYVVLRSDSLRVDVAPVAVAAADTALRPLRTSPGTDSLRWVRFPAFAMLQVVPVLLLLGAVEVRRRRALPPGPRDQSAALIRELTELRMHADSPRLLNELERIALEAVSLAGGAAGDPVSALRGLKRPAAAVELESLLRELHRLRFAPAEPYDGNRLIDRVQAFIAMVAPRRGWSRRTAGVIALVALPAALPADSREDAEDVFFTAVQHYESGAYAAAANAFYQYAQAVPNDAAGWYDLGLASHRAGDTGRAVWAWLRTVEVAPRAADARHNLRAAGAAAALTRVQPIDWLSDVERALAGAAGWWLLLIALAFAPLRPKPRWAVLAPGALVLSFALCTAAIAAARPTLITPVRTAVRLYAAPTTRDAALGELRAGSVARLVERRGAWLRVRTDDGQDAWVERHAVASP